MYPSDPLRLCTECDIHHYENCRGCWGFGVYPEKRMGDGEPLPVTASDAHLGLPRFLYGPFGACPVCGSTIKGPPN